MKIAITIGILLLVMVRVVNPARADMYINLIVERYDLMKDWINAKIAETKEWIKNTPGHNPD